MRISPELLEGVEAQLKSGAQEGRTRLTYLRHNLRSLQDDWSGPAAQVFQRDCHQAIALSEQSLLVGEVLAMRLAAYRERLQQVERQ